MGQMMEKGKSSFYKVWDVLLPFLLYYVAYNAAFILIAFLTNVGMERFGEGFRSFMLGNAENVNGVAGGLSMLAGILPLIRAFQGELAVREGSLRWQQLLLTVVLAFSFSLGLNVLMSVSGIAGMSESFQRTGSSQFGVSFGVGIFLYGVISPLVEEIVFRGLMYNRMRKYYPIPVAVLVSGILFGCYHGNLVQGIYGACMGILLAFVYESCGSFLAPLLFHAVANITVYIVGNVDVLHKFLFQMFPAVILLAIAAVCLAVAVKQKKRR